MSHIDKFWKKIISFIPLLIQKNCNVWYVNYLELEFLFNAGRTAKGLFESEKTLVVAIEIGVINSGYAFSFRHDYQRNPLNVKTFSLLSRESVQFKQPTCILFCKDSQFHSFGFEAEDMFSKLEEGDEQEDWCFFKLFLTDLMTKGVREQ